MTIKEVVQGKTIYGPGEKVEHFYLIMKGFVEARFAGGSYVLHAGDVIGLCEMDGGETFLEYKTAAPCSLVEYPYDAKQPAAVFGGNTDTVKYFVSSLFRQMNAVFGLQKHLKEECKGLYEYLEGCIGEYLDLCEKYRMNREDAVDFHEMGAFSSSDNIPEWMNGYYATLEQMMSIWDHNKTDMDFVCGFLSRASKDIRDVAKLCKEMYDYKREICRTLLNEDGPDVFGKYTAAYYRLMKFQNPERAAAAVLKASIKDILMQLESQGY
jgi:hypothetical protein